MVDYVNFLLRCDSFDGCSLTQTLQLYRGISDLLISLIEESAPEAFKVAKVSTISRSPRSPKDRPSKSSKLILSLILSWHDVKPVKLCRLYYTRVAATYMYVYMCMHV